MIYVYLSTHNLSTYMNIPNGSLPQWDCWPFSQSDLAGCDATIVLSLAKPSRDDSELEAGFIMILLLEKLTCGDRVGSTKSLIVPAWQCGIIILYSKFKFI